MVLHPYSNFLESTVPPIQHDVTKARAEEEEAIAAKRRLGGGFDGVFVDGIWEDCRDVKEMTKDIYLYIYTYMYLYVCVYA